MDNEPISNRRPRSLIIQSGVTVILCAFVACWWAGAFLSRDPIVIVVLLHVCAAFQVFKMGWIIYWWRHSIR